MPDPLPTPAATPLAQPERKRLATDTDDGLLLIISGPSGAGKTTITRAVERAIPGSVFSVSWTTRPKTAADVEAVDYHFVTDEEFERKKAEGAAVGPRGRDGDAAPPPQTQGGFLECVDLFGKKYGTPRAWVHEQLARGRLVILEIDVVGAMKVKAQIPDAFGIFILPPNEAVLLERLRARKREPEEKIRQRFAEARREMDQARDCRCYDLFITNDDLDRAIHEAVAAVEDALRRRRAVSAASSAGTPLPA